MKHHLKRLICVLFFALVVLHLLPLSFSTNSLSSISLSSHKSSNRDHHLNLFWQSIDRLRDDVNKRYFLAATEVARLTQSNATFSASPCFRLIERTLQSGLNEEWSSKLLTSNSFLTSNLLANLLSEQYNTLGVDFDGCLAVKINDENITTTGKYCLVKLNTPQLDYCSSTTEASKLGNLTTENDYVHLAAKKWLTIRNRFPVLAGLCVPAVCEATEVRHLLSMYFQPYLEGIQMDVKYCQTTDFPKLEPRFGYLLAKYSFMTIVIFSLYCTFFHGPLFDHSFKKFLGDSCFLQQMCISFDLHRNLQTLLRTKERNFNTKNKPSFTSSTPSQFDIRFIHGIKSHLILAMLSIHMFFNFSVFFTMKVSYFARFPTFYDAVLDGKSLFDLSVQTDVVPVFISAFFIISGFLSTYVVLSRCNSTNNSKLPSFPSYFLYRYLNLVPLVLATLGLTMLLQGAGSGPLFHPQLTATYVQPCYDFWWTHLLLINNFWNIDQMCGPNMYFISVHFQCYLLLFPVLYLYYAKKRRLAYTAAASLATANLLYLLGMVYFKLSGLPNSFYPRKFNFPAPLDSIRLMYTSPLMHMFSYFFGVLGAFYLLNGAKSRMTMRTLSLTSYRLITFATFTVILLLTYLPICASFKGADANEITSFTYALAITFILVLFTVVCTVWLLATVLVDASSSLFKSYLSIRIPHLLISRLAYGLYFLNSLPIWFNAATSRSTNTLSWSFLLASTGQNILQTLMLAVFVFLFIEAPMRRLNALLFTS